MAALSEKTSSVQHRLADRFRGAATWIALGVLAPLGMLAVSAVMLLDLRKDAWDKAEQTSKNLLQVIERDIARNVEIIDLSLRAVVDNLKAPGVNEIAPELRQLVLFDRATTARDMGMMVVLDETGNIVIDSNAVPTPTLNYADRAYFQAHRARSDLGLHIGAPQISRQTGARVIVLSRRIDKPDGSFGGAAVATLKLSYFSSLFADLGLGRDGAINLYLRDGTRIMRHPYVESAIGASFSGQSNFARFLSQRTGSFTGRSARDGVERFYAFATVGDLPLVLNVALSAKEIEAEWREKALVIGTIVLVLCGLTIGLSLLFGRELRRRAAIQAELDLLSRTDALTGLANRRRFDEALERSCADARRTGKPLSLLVVDADHFKRCNDRYGHLVGDEVLKSLAALLSASVHRPRDLVCRIGGEEFGMLLPDTDQDGALRVAKRVHEAIETLTVVGAGIDAGAITVSIGLAASGDLDSEDLYRRADAALYAAKEGGRNRTHCDAASERRDIRKVRPLRLVG